MYKKIVIIFLLFSFSGYSQNKQIRGFILNESDSLPLPDVNIYNDKYKFGTITNEHGEYILNYPDSISDFNITISSIGFLSTTLPFKNIPNTLYLKESIVQLDDVILVNTNNNIDFVLKKVYENIKINYSNKTHLLKGFYRQTAIKVKDSNYLRVIEADVGFQEYGILKALDRDRIKIYQYRKSDDKITKKWYHEIAKITFGKQNFLVWIKKKDFVKNFVKYKDYHSHYKNILSNYYFEFSNYKMINGDLVAVYNYYRKKYINANLQDIAKSKLFINLTDYAILKVIQVSVLGPVNAYTFTNPDEYIYTKIGNYYYLNSARNTRFLSGLGNENDKEIEIDKLYIYQVIEDRNKFEKIKRKEKEDLTEDVFEKKIKNDTLFWDNYEFLPLVPLKDKLKNVLQQDKSLKEQFIENGKS
ncbi:carboxypeptidase-like regulatory domain-containing protein [Yeosuana sp. AK3]